jgi:hypothetical protein
MDDHDETVRDIENGYVFSALIARHEPPRPEPAVRLAQGPRLMAMLRDPSLRLAVPAEPQQVEEPTRR